MAAPPRNRSSNKSSGSRIAAVAVVALIIGAIAGYFMFSPSSKSPAPSQQPQTKRAEPVPQVANPVTKPAATPAAVAPPAPREQHVTPTPAPAAGKTKDAAPGSARLAIIIDDMGSSLTEARSLAAINVPLTFAIIPELRSDKDVAAFAASHKIETMIHIPMQSKGWPARRLEANGLLVGMSADEIRERVTRFVQRFPNAVGVNNHMGSEFTEQEEQMTTVLQVLKNNNLFFIDSITSPESAGIRVAQKLGVKSARRNVFLDNEQERGYILGQLNQAVKQARKNGSAIAICHPHPATIAALAAALPDLAGQGVRLVPVSQLIR
jgi:polysaccharide deacetylase 2 family uncharacterized protein YibQ